MRDGGFLYPATDAEAADQLTVASDIFARKVLQQPSALSYHRKESSSGVIVMLVVCEVILQSVDPCGQEGNLHFWRSSISLTGLILSDYFVFLVF